MPTNSRMDDYIVVYSHVEYCAPYSKLDKWFTTFSNMGDSCTKL